jgi:hypothetical protein
MVFILLATVGLAQAGEVHPVSDATVAASNWRSGFQADLRYGARLPLFEKAGKPLFQDTGLQAMGTLGLTPAFVRAGGRITFSPLAIVDVHLHGGLDWYFGNFQMVVGYDSPEADPGTNKEIAERIEAGGSRAPGKGFHAGVQAVLKARVGPVVVLGSVDVVHWDVQAVVDGDWYFEREKEVLLGLGGDQSLDANFLLLYQHDTAESQWIRGGSFTTLRAGFSSGDQLMRSGLLLSRGSGDISHTFIVQPYLKSRTFSVTDAPYVAYAFKFKR